MTQNRHRSIAKIVVCKINIDAAIRSIYINWGNMLNFLTYPHFAAKKNSKPRNMSKYHLNFVKTHF